MLYRISFPLPRHGQLVPVTKYVETDGYLNRQKLIRTLEDEKQRFEKLAKEDDNQIYWREVGNLEACIYALLNIRGEDLPRLPINGSFDIPVFCNTQLGPSTIRLSIIKPLYAPRNHSPLKLAEG